MNHKQSAAPVSPEVKIVEASAGSGKTYALAQRYLQLLFSRGQLSDPSTVRTILAITFTHKATREMRERILELLKRIALDAFAGQEEKAVLLQSLGVDQTLARETAFRLLDYIIGHYNFFQVKNIDSFINVILSGCASELHLSANFRIKESYGRYVGYALDECVDHAGRDAATAVLFERFLSQYLFLENRTGWLPKNDMLDILNGLFSQINIYGGSFETFPLEDKELIRLKQNLLSQLRRIHVREPEGMNKQFLKSLGTFLENNPHSFNVADLKSRKFEADSLPMNKGYEAPPELAALWNEFRSGIVELCEKEALALFNCYIDIFREVYAYFRDYARNDDVVFMEELNKQAQVLFEEAQVSVPELYYRLASRFQHFLIDEFQDTSKLQWSNVFLMIEDALATGGSLFYVGDKKQAIYRFRGGDVGLFENIKTAFKQFNVDDSVRLNTNFRSQKEIVSFNNEVFSPENLRRFLEIQQGAEKEDLRRFSSSQIDEIVGLFHDSEQKHIPRKPHGYVRIEHVRYADKEDRDELIRERLITAVRFVSERFPLKSIAILCRSNREIELVTEWLSAEKISVESERTLTIMNNPLIRELTAFLQFLHSPVDTIAFSAFILGDIFLTGTGMRREEITDFIFRHNRRESPGSGYLYRAFRKQYPRVWDTHIAGFFKSVGFVPLYELLVSILETFSVVQSFPGHQGFFMRLLELVKEQEEENPDIALFLEYLKTAPQQHLYVNFSDENAVKVMTIHKAKGLGFPVVLVPFLDMNIRDLGTQIKRARAPYIVYSKENDEKTFGLLRLDAKYARFSPRMKQLYRKEYLKSFVDELNVLYVTFTRAQNELYLFIPDTEGAAQNAAGWFIPGAATERGTPMRYSAPETANPQATIAISAGHYRNWASLLKDEFGDAEGLAHRARARRGEILHALLARVIDSGRYSAAMLTAELRREYPGISEESAAGYKQTIESLLSSDQTRRFFQPQGARVFCEQEFVDRFGRTLRVDRLMVWDEEVWVIDYKSSRENQPEQIVQMRTYLRTVGAVFKPRKTRGFLVYMDECAVEEVAR